mgnify:CR=1 FL=1
MNRLLATLACLLAASSASAVTTCTFQSGGSAVFPPYDALSPAPVDTALNLSVVCSRQGGPQFVTVTVSLGPGQYGTSATTRRMQQAGGTGDLLTYGLFQDPGRSSPWGYSPGIDTLSVVLAVPNKSSAQTTFTVYGRIPPMQDVSAGTYMDSVQVTLTP